MNFQQLRILREAVRQKFNLTEVGKTLFTSQSGVSKHIKELEDELGVELFVRKGKRLLGLTAPGQELVAVVERILRDAQSIKKIADHFSANDQGKLIVATTHTQARYVLPRIVQQFKTDYPKVHLELHQGSPEEIATRLIEGVADIAIATESIAQMPPLISFPFYDWRHIAVVPHDHPLAKKYSAKPSRAVKSSVNRRKPCKITLAELADYPMITYHPGFTGRSKIDALFAEANINPDIVMSALDADVIKTYVELGMGVGIIAQMAFSPKRDSALVALPDSQWLFPENTTHLAVRKGHYLRGFALHFLTLCQPQLTAQFIREKITVGE